ncbi:hypothetical protein PIB30_050547 [Stylosanthes scabra]|uniref:Uncharacterized protein n=1 Tax=Stylosanthes scabra TaxID=79078 RepID=A0ABU6YK45_9FABA|nr:hypothetical protein [Stylosanthes scabra]
MEGCDGILGWDALVGILDEDEIGSGEDCERECCRSFHCNPHSPLPSSSSSLTLAKTSTWWKTQEHLCFWGRPFLATSRALIDMEKGELILRVHEESLILNVYKPMNHHGIRSNLKINSKDVTKQDPPDKPSQDHSLWKIVKEEPNPSLNKAEIKGKKSGVAQASCTD